jgi:teichuronic acid biosynthesis glycosyltransferase TuaC
VYHPRFPVLPKIGMSVAPALLFAGALPAFRRLQRESGDFDMIDAHYFYPDGVAAVMLGKVLGKPVVVTARGTDINLIPEHSLPRWLIRETARRASGIITVSQALHDRLVTIGVPASRIRVLRNGVDLEQFRPMDKAVSRTKLHLNGPTLLSVGQLVELKGHDIIIRSLALLPDYSLLIAGEGPDRSALESLAAKLGVGDRVRFLGRLAHEQLPEIYSAADALILASSREGLPNVLLESMACGTPVVATRVGGIPEVVVAPEAGVLMPERSENGVVTGVRALFGNLPDRADTRRYAAQFGWQETSEGQIRLFQEILGRAQGERRIETTVPEEIAPKDEGPRSPREDPLEDRMALRDIQR